MNKRMHGIPLKRSGGEEGRPSTWMTAQPLNSSLSKGIGLRRPQSGVVKDLSLIQVLEREALLGLESLCAE